MKKDKNIPSDIVDLKGNDQRFTGWRKSAQCAGGNCVEVGMGRGDYTNFVGIRDSKNPDGPILAFTPKEWIAFLAGTKNGDFDEV